MQAQQDSAQSMHAAATVESKRAAAAAKSASSQAAHLKQQLAARAEELAGLRDELLLITREAEGSHSKANAAATQVAVTERALVGCKSRIGVLEKQAVMRDEEMATLRVQLGVMDQKRCAFFPICLCEILGWIN